MYNSKIASLEARIARLESRLTKRSSNPTFEKEYLEHLEKYLSSYFEDTGRSIPPKIIGQELSTAGGGISDNIITTETPFLKIDVRPSHLGQRNISKKMIVDFYDYSESSLDDVRVFLMSCVRQFHKY